MVKDIYSGSGSSSPDYLTAVGNTLYFRATDGTNGVELWKSDGTASGTVMVKDIRSGSGSSSPADLTAVGNTLYFPGHRRNLRSRIVHKPWGFTQKSRILETLTFNASGRGVSEGNPQVHSPGLLADTMVFADSFPERRGARKSLGIVRTELARFPVRASFYRSFNELNVLWF